MKTDLELALEATINIYHQYAIKKPIDDYLSKAEFAELMKENARPFLENTIPPHMTIDSYLKQLFARADRNKDGRLKFTEFLTTLNLLVIEAHNRSHGHGPHEHGPHGHGPHGHGPHGHGPHE